MKHARILSLPEDVHKEHVKAQRLEWWTIAYLVSAIILLYLVLGSSQAMKAAWAEDIISLVPPLAFLVAARFYNRAPSDEFPYGYHRAFSVAHLCAALALLGMGGFLLFDSLSKLISQEHPVIGSIVLFGEPVWLGWLMLPTLVWSGLPAVFLGRAKLPLARRLHSKVLYADADMNKADWLTAAAAMAGVVGIAFGLWWADAAAASLISLDILKDGVSNLGDAVSDLMDERPTTVDGKDADPLVDRVREVLRNLPWVAEADVRLREEGEVYFGEAFVVPRDETDLIGKLEEASQRAREVDWRIHDVVVTPVRALT